MSKSRDLANIISGGFTADDIPNLDASKITTGTISNDRLNITEFDDNKIVNDISTLALRQASDNDKSAYSNASTSVDVFQDDTGIDTHTNTARVSESEFVASNYSYLAPFSSDANTLLLVQSETTNGSTTFTDTSGNNTLSNNSSIQHSTSVSKIGNSSIYFNRSANNGLITGNNQNLNIGNLSGNFTIEAWIYLPDIPASQNLFTYGSEGVNAIWRMNVEGNPYIMLRSSTNWSWSGGQTVNLFSDSTTLSTNTWHHIAWSANSNSIKAFHNGTQTNTGSFSVSSSHSDQLFIGSYFNNGSDGYFNGYVEELRISNTPRYSSNFTPNTTVVDNATGNFTGTTITAPSSVSSMGAIITYQDQAGTNALNTDIVLQLSADGGSNYSTATLTAMPDFSTGIKMAKVNDLAVTAGTQLKYKISFANQSSGSKEARIRGVSLQY